MLVFSAVRTLSLFSSPMNGSAAERTPNFAKSTILRVVICENAEPVVVVIPFRMRKPLWRSTASTLASISCSSSALVKYTCRSSADNGLLVGLTWAGRLDSNPATAAAVYAPGSVTSAPDASSVAFIPGATKMIRSLSRLCPRRSSTDALRRDPITPIRSCLMLSVDATWQCWSSLAPKLTSSWPAATMMWASSLRIASNPLW